MPHTLGKRFRKCGENQDRPIRTRFYASATCGFVTENLVVLGGFRFFPALPENAATPSALKRKTRQIPLGKQPIKRKNRLSAVSTDQAGRTVARSHHSWTLRKNPISVNSLPANRSELRLGSNASVKLHVSRKTPVTTSFPNRDVSFDRPNLTSEQKEGRRINPLQVSPEGFHRNWL